MLGIARGEVVSMPGARMICMRMRNHSAIYRSPRIDVEVPRWAIHALWSQDDEVSGVGMNFSHGNESLSIERLGSHFARTGLLAPMSMRP